MSRARGTLLLVVLLVTGAATPSAAFAVAPTNDTQAGAAPIVVPYSPGLVSLPIPPTGPTGGWSDATAPATEDGTQALPTCFGQTGYRSMWYSVHVPEPSVLTVSLSTQDQMLYRPLLTIISRTRGGVELACSLGPNTNDVAPEKVTASSYVPMGDYLVRIASSIMPDVPPNRSLPALLLETQLRDVTPPVINVIASGSVGVGKAFTFDARGSTDAGSQVNPASAEWTFYDGGPGPTIFGTQLPNPLLEKHSWRTPGLHKVTVLLADNNNNKTTYSLNVFVHSFVPPKVSVRVLASKPGSRRVRLVVHHDMPVKLRLVILQSGNVLRTVPSKTLKGKRTATISIPLTKKIAKTGYLIVSGTASDLSDNPNTVPLKMCSVRPGKAGGTCA